MVTKVPFLSGAPLRATKQIRDGYEKEKKGAVVRVWTRLSRPTRGSESPLMDQELDLWLHASCSERSLQGT